MKAVFSDVHGNSPALRAVLDDIARAGADEIICLGDVVNGVDGATCIDFLLDAGAGCIRGNAEENICTERIESFPSRNCPQWDWVVPTIRYFRDRLSPTQLSVVRSWPSELVRGDAWLIHDSPKSRMEFPGTWDGLPRSYATLVWHGDGVPCDAADPGWRDQATIMRDHGARVVFSGHTHVPCVSRPFPPSDDEICAYNVGSVGMPLDGNPRACWALWVADTVEIRRCEYDVDEIIALIDANGRPHPDPDAYRKMFRQGRHWRKVT